MEAAYESEIVLIDELRARYIPLSRGRIWTLAKDPDSGFPKPVRFGKRAMGWLRADIEQYLRARKGV